MGGVAEEGVEIVDLAPEEREAAVAALIEPWIGDEGPLDAAFQRGFKGRLRHRGIAFDASATVIWDEAGVQVLRAGAPSPDIVALTSEVLLREHLRENGPVRLVRVDYLRQGVLLGSRFAPEGGSHA